MITLVSLLVCIVFIVVSASRPLPNPQLDHQWEAFKLTHKKAYSHQLGLEEARRLIWEDNVNFIRDHNLKYDLGESTFTLGENEFTDLTFDEFKATYTTKMNLSAIIESEASVITFMDPLNTPTDPPSVDWRKQGFVTPIKNQGPCGSCWAFSSTGSTEGQYARRYRRLISLSEQQLVDCDHVDHGCNGGLMPNAFNYIKLVGGIMTEQDYPYTAKQGPCRFQKSRVVARVNGFVMVPHSEQSMQTATATVGPLSIAIDASQRTFQSYKQGVYFDPACTKRIDHAVLIVGYSNTDPQGRYWLVKNSWGKSWGDNGYIKMAKDRNGACGVDVIPCYPLV